MILNWIHLENESQLEGLIKSSYTVPVVVFKHSTRCSISSMALNRLKNVELSVMADNFYFLDLLSFRSLSNTVAEKFKVFHESPQILILRNGSCIYEASHGEINAAELQEQLELAA